METNYWKIILNSCSQPSHYCRWGVGRGDEGSGNGVGGGGPGSGALCRAGSGGKSGACGRGQSMGDAGSLPPQCFCLHQPQVPLLPPPCHCSAPAGSIPTAAWGTKHGSSLCHSSSTELALLPQGWAEVCAPGCNKDGDCQPRAKVRSRVAEGEKQCSGGDWGQWGLKWHGMNGGRLGEVQRQQGADSSCDWFWAQPKAGARAAVAVCPLPPYTGL